MKFLIVNAIIKILKTELQDFVTYISPISLPVMVPTILSFQDLGTQEKC